MVTCLIHRVFSIFSGPNVLFSIDGNVNLELFCGVKQIALPNTNIKSIVNTHEHVHRKRRHTKAFAGESCQALLHMSCGGVCRTRLKCLPFCLLASTARMVRRTVGQMWAEDTGEILRTSGSFLNIFRHFKSSEAPYHKKSETKMNNRSSNRKTSLFDFRFPIESLSVLTYS